MRGEGQTLKVAEYIMSLLSDGSFTATYKYALLLSLMDCCVEQVKKDGVPRNVLTTRQLAEKYVQLYAPHLLAYQNDAHDGVLRQNSGGDARWGGNGVLRAIYEYREKSGSKHRLLRVVGKHESEWRRMVDTVEWILIWMPLPRLQIVAGRRMNWLYRIHWGRKEDPDLPAAHKSEVRAYQKGEKSAFDNRVLLLDGVAEALLRLQPTLRPLIQTQWTLKVAQLNRLQEARLHDFLFGTERDNLRPLASPLLEVQKGVCFYCEGRMMAGARQVDHFIPWARYPSNDLSNLVLSHAGCNAAKRDWLVVPEHVDTWIRRRELQASELSQVATHTGFQLNHAVMSSIARSQYGAIPEQTPLWLAKKEFEPATTEMLGRVLANL